MTWLLDGNALVALAMSSHMHHDRVHCWFSRLGRDRFATCPTTQGTLLRVHMKSYLDHSAAAAWRALREVSAHPKHEWWEDGPSFLDVPHRHLQGHGQVTDAWLAELARRRNGRVATLDSGFALLHADVATLLPRMES
ncbi:MAG: VapC toxin family PIN domain ribonuclease [Acidobacteria bacterium]|nr:VapC toxin family PIN domain ribonuclease [Acidobacteriota bacterium]